MKAAFVFLLASSLLGQQAQPPYMVQDGTPTHLNYGHLGKQQVGPSYRPGIKNVPLSELPNYCDDCNPIILELPKPFPVDEKPLTYCTQFDLKGNVADVECPSDEGQRVQIKPAEPIDFTPLVDLDSKTTGTYMFTHPFPQAISVPTAETTIVKLSDEEYAYLEALRQAVVDEEKRLAVKYGAGEIQALCSSLFSRKAASGCEVLAIGPHYEFHQQFLLIDKGAK